MPQYALTPISSAKIDRSLLSVRQFSIRINDDALSGDNIHEGDTVRFNIGFDFFDKDSIYLIYVVSLDEYFPARVVFDFDHVILKVSNNQYKDRRYHRADVQIRAAIVGLRLVK